jgi:glutamate/aspartate transport system substrate-binding protein
VLTSVGRAIPVCLALLLASPAAAQDKVRIDPERFTGTLQKIKNSGAIRLGYRENSVPFAFLADGHPAGYSIDLCNAIVEAVGAALGGGGVRVDYRPVTPQNRFSLLISGDIDLECGSSTNSSERREQVAFSPVIFVTGTELLVKRASRINGLRDLKRKTVVVTAGTTNAAAVEALAEKQRLGITFAVGRDHNESFAILAAGKADAFANDEVLLHAWVAEAAASGDYRIVGDPLSYEPYGLAFRKDDFEFDDIVERTFRRLTKTGEIVRLYKKWFVAPLPSGASLNLPISPELAESFRTLAFTGD